MTMHNICKIYGSNLSHHKKKNTREFKNETKKFKCFTVFLRDYNYFCFGRVLFYLKFQKNWGKKYKNKQK